MKSTIFYFSATGNSLTTAQILSKHLPYSCQCIAVSSLKEDEKIMINDDVIGFVFPIYYGDMPYLVREVINKFEFTCQPYIYLVATYRGHAGDIAKRLDDILRQKKQSLALSLGVTMPGNSWISTPEENAVRLAHQEEAICQLIPRIIAQDREDYSKLDTPKPSPISNGPINMRGIMADDTCIGCGTCVRVCPMNNIQILDKKAVIGNNCLTCLACFHWCPIEAIYMSKEKEVERRFKYHHPDITLQDIISQKKK